MREFKRIFDPRGLMNPGKKVDAPPLTENLRYGPSLPAARDQDTISISRARADSCARRRDVQRRGGLPQARRPGRCAPPTWPPATRATRLAAAPTPCATRWRAAAGFDRPDFTSKATYEVMDLCLSCKACKTECPSSVDMAKLKTEFLAHYHEAHGTPLRARLFGHIHRSSRLTCAGRADRQSRPADAARPTGDAGDRRPPRAAAVAASRSDLHRALADARRNRAADRKTRGKVVYFHDTFTDYNYPRIGMAAVKLLEAAGFEVIVEERHACCGRPMLSKGLMDERASWPRRERRARSRRTRRRDPHRRHRAELHPDPARRVPSISCPATPTSKRSRATPS